MNLTLTISNREYSIYKLSNEQFQQLDVRQLSPFFSLSRSSEEISLLAPSDLEIANEKAEGGWLALFIEGVLPFTMVGVLASILKPLAEAKISILAISTFDTDFVCFKKTRLSDVIAALEPRGFSINCPKRDLR